MEVCVNERVSKTVIGICFHKMEQADIPAEPDIFRAELTDVATEIYRRRFGAELELFKYIEHKIDEICCASIAKTIVQLETTAIGNHNIEKIVSDLNKNPASALTAFLALHGSMDEWVALAVKLRIAVIQGANSTHIGRDAIRNKAAAVLDMVVIDRLVISKRDIEFEIRFQAITIKQRCWNQR